MKNLFYQIISVGLIGVFVAVGVWAATDTVTASVTVSYAAVSLDQASFAYGTMPANTASTTLTLWSGAGVTATNDGSQSDFDIYGANTASWTLDSATSTPDYYIHKFCNDTDNDCVTDASWSASYTALTTSPQTLKDDVAADGTVAFQLSLHAPNPSTVFTSQNAVVTIQTTAD